ncbi:MAG TPA: hypothetical protein VEN47_09545 [Myxococcota bacterium]|nr:hypothetical protein [Myxococcota bacterium]
MARRVARSLAVSLALAALLAAGSACHKAKEADAAAPRATASVWADVLTARDAMHAIMAKPLEDVTHADCAELGVEARKVDALMSELTATVAADKDQSEGHLRAIGDVLGLTNQVLVKIRESALAETPGTWEKLRFPFDQSLHSVETYFTADQLGGQSVVRRPGYETTPLPPPLSPV